MSLHQDILNTFVRLSNDSVEFVKVWRQGKKEVLTKINVNNQIDVVTELDCQIELNAKEILNKMFPDFKFIGEEGFKGDFDIFDHNYFIIDPIDGTKPFVEGSKDWGVSICAVIEDVPSVALLNIPDKHLFITGVVGEEVKLNGLSVKTDKSNNQKIVVSPRQLKMVEECFENTVFKPQEMSALTPKIASVISGESEAALYFPENGKSASIWDYAAGCFLLKQTGGTMRSFNGNELPYSGSGVIHKDGWIASRSEKTFEDIKKLVKSKL